MTERKKAIEECLDECTAIARTASNGSSSGAWSCVRALQKMLWDEKDVDAKSVPADATKRNTNVRL